MSKSVKVLFEHVLQSADLVADYIKDATKKKLLEDVGLQDKVIRRLQLLVRRLNICHLTFETSIRQFLGRKSGMRDILVHEYYNVDAPLVWRGKTDYHPCVNICSRVIENNNSHPASNGAGFKILRKTKKRIRRARGARLLCCPGFRSGG